MHFLKLSILSFLLFLTSCDDGDIIISQFNFDEDDTIAFCYSEESDETVFYNYNNDNNEVIYVIIDDEYAGDEEQDESDSDSEQEVPDGAIVTYIKFDNDIDEDDYFCTAVASVESIERELNGTGGTVTIITRVDTTSDGDNDGDGISNVDEGYFDIEDDEVANYQDSDGDSIFDYLDEDDDNDNVKTRDELGVDEDSEIVFTDTDADGTPDYLDPDDDGDGILTRFEVTEDDPTPDDLQNVDNEIPFYLDAEYTDANFQADINIENSYVIIFETIVKAANLVLSANNENTVTYDSITLGTADVNSNVKNTFILNADGTITDFITEDEDEDQ